MTVCGVGGACCSPSSTSGAQCQAEPGTCWGFIDSSFPIAQLRNKSDGIFRCGGIPGNRKGLGLKVAQGFVQWGGLAGTCPEKQGRKVYLAPCAPPQCFSLEEDDLNLTSLDAETILEAEEILGTMQNYLDSSVISIIEDLSLSEVGAHRQAREVVARLALAVAWMGVAAASPMAGVHGRALLPSETTPAFAAEQGLPGCAERAVSADCHHRDPGQHRR